MLSPKDETVQIVKTLTDKVVNRAGWQAELTEVYDYLRLLVTGSGNTQLQELIALLGLAADFYEAAWGQISQVIDDLDKYAKENL